MRRSLVYRLSEIHRIAVRFTRRFGPGLAHLFVASAQEIVFFCFGLQGCRDEGRIRPGLPSLRMAGTLQHFWADAWRLKAASKLCWALLDVTGTRQLLFSSHLRDWDKMLLRSICGGWSHLHLTSFASLSRPWVDLGCCFSLH